MFKRISKALTKNYTAVPLFWVSFDLNKYTKHGAKNSCLANIHPQLEKDEHIANKINDIIDYIRDNYDMDKISKI